MLQQAAHTRPKAYSTHQTRRMVLNQTAAALVLLLRVQPPV
jgi:hypothetical protein